MKVPINGSLFSIREVADPLVRDGRRFAIRIRYQSREILLSRDVPEELKKHVLAAAVSAAHQHRRVPLIWPKWGKNESSW